MADERRSSRDPEVREEQMISLAVDLAEQQLRDGTASAQVITHYLKLASRRERLEREIMEKQRDLLVAKTKAAESGERIEALYTEALSAMRSYQGDNGDLYRERE